MTYYVSSGTLNPTHSLTLRLVFIVECGIARFLCAMPVFDVRASSSPLGYLGAKFRFCTPIAELARRENGVLTHSPSLFDALGAEAFAPEFLWTLRGGIYECL